MDYDMLTSNELRDMLELMQKRAQGVNVGPANQRAAEKIAETIEAELKRRNAE